MTNIYANVGKTGNLARSLLLIDPKLARFYRFLHPIENAKSLEHSPLPKIDQPEKSAEICKNLHSEQIFAPGPSQSALRALHIPPILGFLLSRCARLSSSCILHLASCIVQSSPPSKTAGKTRTDQLHINRTKSIVFAKKSLPDYSISAASTGSYGKRKSSFFRIFSQKRETFAENPGTMKMNRINTKQRMAVLCGGTCVSPVVSPFTTYAKQKQRTFLKTFDREFSGKLEWC